MLRSNGGCRAGPCVGVEGTIASGELLRQAEVGDAGGDPRLDPLELGCRRAAGVQLLDPAAKAARLLGLHELKRFFERGLQTLQWGLSHNHRAPGAAAAAPLARRGGFEVVDDVADGVGAVGEGKASLTVLSVPRRRLHYRLTS
uniref:Uncharacterized protein n=1 Tax=Triticum urartu TaxID=4572 RepID=A0A8R7QZK6_TRIUA